MKMPFLVSKRETQLYYKSFRLMLCRKVLAVQCENNTKRTNTLCGQNVKFDVTYSKVHHTTGHGGPDGGVEVQLYSFLKISVRWGGLSTPRPGRFTPG